MPIVVTAPEFCRMRREYQAKSNFLFLRLANMVRRLPRSGTRVLQFMEFIRAGRMWLTTSLLLD